MEKQIVSRCVDGELPELPNFSPLLQRVFAGRGVQRADEVDYALSSLLPFNQLLGVDQAVERLAAALEQQEHIVIIGDFDADGATSTALSVKALKAFGAQNVSYLVPNRFEYGYGLTPEIVEVASKREPQLIMTVDNGTASHTGVDRANELGIDVIITDHHLPADTLPKAVAIVNPNQSGDPFPSKNLAGVGVAFYVMLALRAHLKEKGWFAAQAIATPKMSPLLDYVALGTVADVVPLDKNNRILVHQGLRRIRAACASPGILALIVAARRQAAQLKTSDLAYSLAPRLNAAGRLEDMSYGIACLLADDLNPALKMAKYLNQLNVERRTLETQMAQEAYAALDNLDLSTESHLGIALYDETWHQGIIGLVAARVKEKCHRPVVAFAKVNEHEIKGSARSIKGIHIRDALNTIATQHPDLITKFGGHAMAAGLSLPLDHFEPFREAFSKAIADQLQSNELQPIVETDGELTNSDFTLANAEALQNAAPWGQGFPEPLFDGVFRIVTQRLVGDHHLKLSLQPNSSSIYVDAIAFNVDRKLWPNYNCDHVRLLYRLDINYFRNQRSLQLLAESLFPVTES